MDLNEKIAARRRELASQNDESGKRILDHFLHIFVVRGESQKGIALRIIGGVVTGAIAANIIHWAVTIIHLFARMSLSDTSNYGDTVLLIYDYGEAVETIGATLVFWYALRRQDKLVAFRNIFGIALASYVLWLVVLQMFFAPKEEVVVGLVISSLICTFGLVLAVWSQRRARIQT